MPYAVASQVEARNPKRVFTGSSLPATDQVTQYLVDTAAELDGILLARGYTVPVATSATSAHELMVNYNVLGAHFLAEQAAPTSDREESAQKAWENAKKMLKDGKIELDAARDTTESSPRGPTVPSAYFFRDQDF